MVGRATPRSARSSTERTGWRCAGSSTKLSPLATSDVAG
ncbi:Uncharacterised protein [Mycobacteroides abscessus]|nr:Uncharacterised protein [Mycobacteroides abscessus]